MRARGEKHGRAKLSEKTILTAMADKAAGASTRGLARRCNISRRQMQRVLSGQQWKHLQRQ